MAYTDQSQRPSPASMTAVITIHALMGLALVTGLTVSGSIIKDKDITAIFIPKDIPKPPEPIPTPVPTEITPSSRPIVTPPPPIDLNRSNSDMDTTTKIPPTRPIEQQPGERAPLGPTPAATNRRNRRVLTRWPPNRAMIHRAGFPTMTIAPAGRGRN